MTVDELIQVLGRYGEPQRGFPTWHGGKWEVKDGHIKRYVEGQGLVDVTEGEIAAAMDEAKELKGHFDGVPAYTIWHNDMFIAVGYRMTEDPSPDPARGWLSKQLD